ncbi:MAG TPA: hypothetical protein VGX68_07845 [Thermoanaerobaculia bacterium]|nr:hypothetical protein [Thermoanaerobaculia bacterium]
MNKYRWLPISVMLLILFAVLQPYKPSGKEDLVPGAVNSCEKNSTKLPVITRVLVNWAHDPIRVAWPPDPKNHVALVFLGQQLTIQGCNLGDLQKKETPLNPLQLYLHGMPFIGAHPTLLYNDDHKLTGARFELKRTEESKDAWTALLGRPKTTPETANISLGLANCQGDCTDITNAVPIRLVALRENRLKVFVIALLLLLIAIIWLAVKKGLLLDRGPGSPWSLGRTQMAWWTFFVVGSFLFIWIVNGSYSSLSPSVLALIGISSGTALLGAVMDDTKESQRKQRLDLENEKQTLVAKGALTAAEQTRLDEINRQLQGLPVIKHYRSEGFLTDILSDENGVSFHRMQIVIWMVVLTAIFVVRVYATLSMPEFDAQLLGLTGISAGTYLGFKFPEKMS